MRTEFPNGKQGGATLLLVDDDPNNREMLSRRLVRDGYTVVTARTGSDALEILGLHRIDAVLLDATTPGANGVDTLRRLRESRSVADLPVIMVTANDRSADVVDALDAGANDYVTKPIDFPVALARIRLQLTARRVDPLTGLLNRVVFEDELARSIEALQSGNGLGFAVFILDIDRFKLINDSLGRPAGDEVLVGIARRLQQSLRSTDTIARFGSEHTLARLGGDEFTVLLKGVVSQTDARSIAERLLAAVAPPFTIHGRELYVSASIGIAMSDRRYDRADAVVRNADTAMNAAKARGKARFEIFEPSMTAIADGRLQLESDLRRALERGELRVYYQPIVALADARVCGFEALLRWQHPVRGLVLPADFIPIAEETGLIVPIGYWALKQACVQMRAWDRLLPANANLAINVNLSVRQCMQHDLVRNVAEVLRDTGLAPHRLMLEITESVLLESSGIAIGILSELRDLGVQLGLDDFGLGYSTLSCLQRFSFHTLKIDRSFVKGMQEAGNAEIVRAIVSLAGGLAMDVTAEGIETVEQLAMLKALSCDHGQGFYFYEPLARERAEAVLRQTVSA